MYLRVMVTSWNPSLNQETHSMSSIQFTIPDMDTLNYDTIKEQALKYITSELDRYGLEEALGGIGIRPDGNQIQGR